MDNQADNSCRHAADIGLIVLSKALFAGRTLVSGEITGWRFKCRKCGAYLKYENRFSKSSRYWSIMSWLVSCIAILPPIVFLIVYSFVSGEDNFFNSIPSTPLAVFLLMLALMIVILVCGLLGHLLFCLLIKHGIIGKFVPIPYDSWKELAAVEDAMKTEAKQKEIETQRKARIFIYGFWVFLLVLITILVAVANN